jgi:hypothetical protein
MSDRIDELKGNVKKGLGDLTGNKRLETEGEVQSDNARAHLRYVGPLVALFLGLFGTPQAASGAILELHTLIALVIYALVAWLLAKGAWLVFGEGRSASVARTDTERTRVR